MSTSHLDNVLPWKSHILHKFISMFLICNQIQGEDFPLGYSRGKKRDTNISECTAIALIHNHQLPGIFTRRQDTKCSHSGCLIRTSNGYSH